MSETLKTTRRNFVRQAAAAACVGATPAVPVAAGIAPDPIFAAIEAHRRVMARVAVADAGGLASANGPSAGDVAAATRQLLRIPDLSHVDTQGRARMVDVSDKAETDRIAIAGARVVMKPETPGAV